MWSHGNLSPCVVEPSELKGLSLIPTFLHMSWDNPKPQALTQAVVPAEAAKIHSEEYSCSLSNCAPFGFIVGEHKVL